MSLTLAKANTATASHTLGNRREIVCDVTLDNSYPTGGYTLTPANFGLELFVDSVTVVPYTTGHTFAYDIQNNKLRVFSGGTEISNATDLHTVVGRLTVRGKGSGYPIS